MKNATHKTPSPTITAAMIRALELAARGPSSNANPQVGCVILDNNGKIVAEGWHEGSGTPHAEVMALNNLPHELAENASDLTAVVTLEPCNHTGKTGPCSLALIEAGIGAVRYAVSDPGEQSSGGAERLLAAGVDLNGGILEEKVREFMRPWLTVEKTGLPYVTLKWASSLDGRAAAADGTSKWITGAEARADVHEKRSQASAIVAGTGTVLADDPSLTARRTDGSLYDSQPVPVVIGTREVPAGAAIRHHPKQMLSYDGSDLESALKDMLSRGIRSVYIEGGPTLASAFIRAGLVNEVNTYIAPVILGGDRLAITDAGVVTITQGHRLTPVSITPLGNDVRIVALYEKENN